MDFKSITVVAVDRIQGTYQTKYAVEEGERTRFDGSILPLQGTRTKLVADSGKTFVQDNAPVGPSYANDEWHTKHGTVSSIFVPLTGKDGVMGSLNLTSTKSGAFGAREQAILEVLANQIAPAVENAQLYEENLKSQKAFQESDARYRRLMMQTADPFILSDPDGKIMDVNELVCQGLGYTREELLEMTVADFAIRTLPDVRKENWKRLVAGEIVVTETTHRRKNGTTFPVEMRMTLVELDGRQYRSALIRDVTVRKRAEEERTLWAEDNSVMAEIGRIASSSLDLSEVYERVGQEIHKIIAFHRMNLAVLRPDVTSFFAAWVIGGNMAKHSWSVPISIDGTMAARALETRAPVIFEAASDEEILQEFPGMTRAFGSGLRSFLSAPLISRGNVIAVLQLRSKDPNAYSQRHLDLAVRVADQISGATAASQSFLQQKESEERVKATLLEKEVRLHENSVMAEIGRISSSSLDLSEVYELLGQEVQTLIPFQRMTLVLVNAESSTFSRLFTTGSALYTNRQIGQLPLHGTMSGQVYMTGQPVMRDSDDPGNLRREFPGLALGIDGGLKSFLSAPLVSRGNVIAVLQVASTEPQAYSRRHLDLPVRVAYQITGAIAAAQLYQH